MHKEALANFPLIPLVHFGQFLCLVVFVGALFWIYRKGSGQFYDRLANLPLSEESSRD